MYKIEQQPTGFSINCYFVAQNCNLNKFLWARNHIQDWELASELLEYLDEETASDVLRVLRLTNRPAYVSDSGCVTAVDL